MKKTNLIILAVFAGFLISLSACKKTFLDEEVYSSYAPQTLTDSLGFEASVIGMHNLLSTFFSYSDPQGWPSVWHAGTDIALVPPTQKQGIEVPYYDYTQLISTDGAASYTWNWGYRMVNNANIIIKNIESGNVGNMSTKNKNSINGEARFFRAYAYNILATCFGKVPLVKEPLTAPKTDFTRASLDSINALIIEDLTFAAANLPEPSNLGSTTKTNADGKPIARANRYQAMQLLAEAYIRSGKPALAEAQCDAIINSGKYTLTSSRYGIKSSLPGDPFNDMFWYGNQRRYQGNREAIWVMEQENPTNVVGGITNNPQQRRNWGAAYYQISGMKICDSLGGRGIARMRLTNWVVYDLYEANDMRNSQFNLRRKFYYNTVGAANYGQQVPYAGADTVFKIAPHTTKWYEFNPNDEFGFAMVNKDFILMRLGETYLLKAEAQFRQGNTSGAATTLTTLRARSNASAVSASQVTLDFILDERARELLAEENRRMTLMRTGTLVDRVTRLNVQTMNPVIGISAKNLLMPIPQTEINLNKDAVLEQNTGY
ncbi:MAG: RagB/SusD family nutrient uptake outer membrane protein [Lacibacter sp.]